jgi:ATP-dependent Clp protease ATP-binding subunit ClpC
MFEHYTEKARRTIFFGRYEASEFGSAYIETEHLLLGLLREDKALANRFLRSRADVDSIRKQIERHTVPGEKVPTSVDLPLSLGCKRVLTYGAEEAERLNHKHIGTEPAAGAVARREVLRRSTARRTRPHLGLGTEAVAAIGTSACSGRVCLVPPSRSVARRA